MLSKNFRLPFSVVFHNPSVYREREFTVRMQRNNLPFSRFGFVVAKTVDKRATERNRLKRMVRSVMEKNFLSSQGWDVLVVLSPAIAKANQADVQEKIMNILKTHI